jgi:hypothetical protein
MHYAEREPIYIVIFRDTQAEHHLLDWAKRHNVDPKHIDRDRLNVYNQTVWFKFQTTWTRNWNRITVWDCWQRRHIEVN